MGALDVWTLVGVLMTLGLSALADDQSANSVSVKIYQLSVDKWTGGTKAQFEDAIAAQANVYCDNDPSACGLNSNSPQLSSTDVVYSDGSPSYKKPYLTVEFALQYPTGADKKNTTTSNHVPKAALEALTSDAIDRFEESSGYHIVEVGEEEFSIPPNGTLNIVLCIVAVVLLLAVLVTCQVLNWKCGGPPEAVSKDDDSKGDGSATAPLELTSMETVKTKPDATNGAGAEYSAVNT